MLPGGDGAAVLMMLRFASGVDAGVEAVPWVLPRGELLAAWPEEGEPGKGGVYPPRLALALTESGSGSSVLFLRLAAPLSLAGDVDTTSATAPTVEAVDVVPGLAACAAARSQLRLLLASPKRTFTALIEARGQNAVGIFRNPTGVARAPTAAPDLDGLLVGAGVGIGDDAAVEVMGALLSETAVLVLLACGVLVRVALDASVRLEVRPRPPLAARNQMPMGVDPKSLLRMLDMQGED